MERPTLKQAPAAAWYFRLKDLAPEREEERACVRVGVSVGSGLEGWDGRVVVRERGKEGEGV